MKDVLRRVYTLVPGDDTGYLTHDFHPFPAKFPPQIPRRILEAYARPGLTIGDPFCGSGTTLVEARLFGCSGVGNDINPLACFISRVKATPVEPKVLAGVDKLLLRIGTRARDERWSSRRPEQVPDFPARDHWFQPHVINELSWLSACVHEIEEPRLRDLFLLALSSIIVRVSNQDSDTRYAAVKKRIRPYLTVDAFLERAIILRDKMIDFYDLVPKAEGAFTEVYNDDARNLKSCTDELFDMVITSPPYANTYDYYLYHKHRKFWLGMDVYYAQFNEIGSRREFSSLKEKPEKWREDLSECFVEMARVTRRGGLIFVVIGDSVIAKRRLDAAALVLELAAVAKLEYLAHVSAPLAQHSRMFSPAFAQQGKSEHLIALRRV